MSKSKKPVLLLIGVSLVLALAAEIMAQGVVQRRRIVRERFKQIEVYFDGGYFISGMGTAEDALDAGYNSVASLLDSAVAVDGGAYSHSKKNFENERSMGGGINYHITPNYGVGLKFIITQHDASSDVTYSIDNIVTFIPNLGDVIVNVNQMFNTIYRYHQAPIIANFFYNLKPFPNSDKMSLTVGGGPGLYVTSIDLEYEYINHRFDVNTPPRLNLADNFVRYYDRVVSKPIGGYVFGGLNIKGSSVISLSLNAEYHYVLETDIDKWQEIKDWRSYPFDKNDPFMINPETEEPIINPETGEPITSADFFNDIFSGYRPDKLNISGLRIGATVSFAF